MFRQLGLALPTVALSTVLALAQEVKPALVYDVGDPLAKALSDSARGGAERFKSETGIAYAASEPQAEGQREEALRRFARDGYSPIIAVGRAQAAATDRIAKEFPNVRFTIIDTVIDLANVQSLVFKEEEGSYLVGLLAGKTTKTGKVGFIGGVDEPVTRRYACGYAQGLKSGNDKAELFQNMTGATSEAWSDPVRGAELARTQIDRGADVIFHAARLTGIGVLRAAADAGRLGIGSEVNQNGLFPGKVFTSMVKRADVAAFRTLMEARTGSWKPGVTSLGVKEEGVGFVIDDNNRSLIAPQMKAAADRAAADIASGVIKVHDYAPDQRCAL